MIVEHLNIGRFERWAPRDQVQKTFVWQSKCYVPEQDPVHPVDLIRYLDPWLSRLNPATCTYFRMALDRWTQILLNLY